MKQRTAIIPHDGPEGEGKMGQNGMLTLTAKVRKGILDGTFGDVWEAMDKAGCNSVKCEVKTCTRASTGYREMGSTDTDEGRNLCDEHGTMLMGWVPGLDAGPAMRVHWDDDTGSVFRYAGEEMMI